MAKIHEERTASEFVAMAEEFKFSGKLCFEEYLEGHLVLAALRRRWIRTVAYLIAFGMIVCGLAFFPMEQKIALSFCGLVMLTYPALISPWQFRFRVRQNWDRYPKMRKEIVVTLTDDGVASKDDKGNPTHMDWDNFIKFKETKSLYMLYLSPLFPLCLPKRLLEQGSVEGLRSLLEARIRSNSRSDGVS